MCCVVELCLSLWGRETFVFFSVSAGGGGCVFAVFSAPIPEKGISDFIAHGSILQVFTACEEVYR